MKKALALLIGLIFIAVIACVVVSLQFMSKRPSDSSDVVLFEVEPSHSFKAISHELERQGLVTSATKFQVYARLATATGKVRVGEYAIRRDSLPRDVLKTITSGKSVEYIVTVQEGLNKYDIAAMLERQNLATKKEFLSLVDDKALTKELAKDDTAPTLEGYLFPETYHVTKFTGPKGLIRLMVARFFDVYNSIPPNADLKLTRQQIVTLASIVEKETGAIDERAIVASVFHNRLRLNMKLQTDPTIVYGVMDSGKKYDGNIHHTDIITPTRYNTYTMTGLPYGPISNPGRDALTATIHPATTEFLFFVSRNNGTHVYSKDYAQHTKAVTKFQLDPHAREGHSWREKSAAQAAAKTAALSSSKAHATATPTPAARK